MSTPPGALRMTLPTLVVLRELLRHDRELYGLEVMRATGLDSGAAYPILARLLERGWVKTRAERRPPLGRPPRRYYRLTAAAAERARKALADRGMLP